MIPYLIELRDNNICVRNHGEVFARSPGFANIAGSVPVFGEEARMQTRLHPRMSFNQFWSQLSLDPLLIKNKHFRHTADLAYSHLDSLTRPLNIEHGAVLAAPSNYSRTQLAVLLGMVKQCAFATVGLVDLALLQAAGSPAEECIIIDLQLHQAVLSSFRKVDGHLLRERVVQVPSAGLLGLQDAWINMISDEFISQSRFDPQRNAETEQFLANQLGHWLAASQSSNELLLEINLKGSVHQARLTRAHFEQRSQTIFNRIGKELEELRNAGSALHLPASLMSLPGLTQYIPDLIALDDDVAIASCLQNLAHIRRAPDSLQFVTRLPLGKTASTTIPAAQPRMPTHVLLHHKAVMLPSGRLTLGTPPARLESARIMPLAAEAGFSGAIALVRTSRGLQLELHTQNPVLHNGQPAHNGQNLSMGDTLQLGSKGPELQLIVVEQSA